MKKKIKLLSGALLVSSLLLSACGESSTTSSDSTKSKDSKVTIEFFNMKPEIKDLMDGQIAKFEEQNPNIVVKQNNVPNPLQVLATRISSNDTPELYSDWPNRTWQMKAKAGVMLDLTGESFLNNIEPAARDLFKLNGKEYTVPLSYNTVGVVYNEDIFKKLNLEVPKTFDELVNDAKKIKAAGITPFAMEGKSTGAMRQSWYTLLPGDPNFEAFEKDSISGDLNGQDKNVLKETAQKFSTLASYAQSDVLGTGTDQARALFANGQAAMMITGNWVFPVIKQQNPNMKFAMFPMPATNAEDTKVTVFPGDFALQIAANAKNPKETKKFVEFLTQKENAQEYAEKTGAPSTVKGVTSIVPELEYQYSFIKDNKMELNPDSSWTQETKDQVNAAVQQLVMDKNSNNFVNTLIDSYKSGAASN